MKIKKLKYTVLVIMFFGSKIFCQDTLVLKNGDIMYGWIEEINNRKGNISYKSVKGDQNFIVSKSKVREIQFRNGFQITQSQKKENKVEDRIENPLATYIGITNMALELNGITLNFDYFLTTKFNFSIDISVFGPEHEESNYSLGFHYNFIDTYSNKFIPYAGLMFGGIHGEFMSKIPIGIKYFNSSGVALGLNGNIGLFNNHLNHNPKSDGFEPKMIYSFDLLLGFRL